MLELLTSALHIGNQASVGEPQRVNSIALVIPGLTGGSFDELSLGLQQFTIPKPLGTSNKVSIQRGIQAKHFAGNLTFDDLNIQFKDYVDRPVFEQLMSWRGMVYNPLTKQLRAAALYKKDCEVFLIGPEGTRNRSIIVKGMWPMAVDPGDADLSSDEPVNLQAAFSYDDCLPGRGFDTSSWLLSAGISFVAGAAGGSIGGAISAVF